MAQKVQIILTDDIDGGSADETVRFGLDGANYEIDLSDENAGKLREALRPFVAKARRSSGRVQRGRGATPARNREAAEIRKWARENGYKVSDRGRVQAEIQEAYRKAMGQS